MLSEKFTKKKLSKPQATYYVVEKVRGKFKKLYPKPLIAKDAKDYAVYSIDNRLSKTAFFVPLGKTRNVIKPPKNIVGYYSKNKFKVRPYKIRYGKKKQMVNGFIEKRKYSFDKPGERTKKKASKRGVKKRTPMVKRTIRQPPIKRKATIKRKISPQQRKVMLKNLAKARAARKIKNRRK